MKFLFLKGEFIPATADGRKTQTIRTRRPSVRPGETFRWNPNGRSPVLRCTRLDCGPIGGLTEAEARADGFASLADLLSAASTIYGISDLSTEVWVVGFEVVAPDAAHFDFGCPTG